MFVTAVVTVPLSCAVTCSPYVNELARRPALAICVTAQARSAFLLTSVMVRARRLVRSDKDVTKGAPLWFDRCVTVERIVIPPSACEISTQCD